MGLRLVKPQQIISRVQKKTGTIEEMRPAKILMMRFGFSGIVGRVTLTTRTRDDQPSTRNDNNEDTSRKRRESPKTRQSAGELVIQLFSTVNWKGQRGWKPSTNWNLSKWQQFSFVHQIWMVSRLHLSMYAKNKRNRERDEDDWCGREFSFTLIDRHDEMK